MKTEEQKPMVFCGVINMDGTPAKMTEEEKERFVKMCSNNGQYNAVFCEDNSIPKAMEELAKILKT